MIPLNRLQCHVLNDPMICIYIATCLLEVNSQFCVEKHHNKNHKTNVDLCLFTIRHKERIHTQAGKHPPIQKNKYTSYNKPLQQK